MELKYIWVEEYKNLKDIDFNFSHSLEETFIYSEGKLTISKQNQNRPKGFFESNVNGVTMIVGKNGSGKTNLTEFLHYNLSHVTNGSMAIWKTSKGLIVLGKFVFIQKDIVIDNTKELEEMGYLISRYERAPLDTGRGVIGHHEMEKNKYIYYNPVFDFRILPLGSGRENLQNISTSYLAWNDVYHSKIHTKEKADLLQSHERMEKLRESSFILNYSEITNFIHPIPSELILSMDVVAENWLVQDLYYNKEEIDKDQDKEVLQQQYEELRGLREHFKSYWVLKQYLVEEGYEDKYLLPTEIKKQFFRGLFWVNFFCIYLKIDTHRFPVDFFRKFIYDEEWKLENKALSHRLKSLKKTLNKFVNSCEWMEKLQSVKNLEESTNEAYNTSKYDLFRNSNYKTETKDKKQHLQLLIEDTKGLLKNNLPFHFTYNNRYSSGQQKLLNFYSRFYWASKEIAEDEKKDFGIEGERVIILIDEGEVSLHPEWQRKFFQDTLDFLTNLFKGRDLQLIYITHSPFVLSDIPKENVIFLDKDIDGNALKKEVKMEKTFGANIYTLLSDSFFMKNGTIGEFAKKKIEWVVKVLGSKNPQLDPETLREANYIIDCVGEPMIKQQLETLRNNALNDDKVNALERRIQELEDELNKPNDNDKNQ